MDLNIILASTQNQALSRLKQGSLFHGMPGTAEPARDYAMRPTHIPNASEIIGDVWHHADQILTYTSGVILGIDCFRVQQQNEDEGDEAHRRNNRLNTSGNTTFLELTCGTQTGITCYFASAGAYN